MLLDDTDTGLPDERCEIGPMKKIFGTKKDKKGPYASFLMYNQKKKKKKRFADQKREKGP